MAGSGVDRSAIHYYLKNEKSFLNLKLVYFRISQTFAPSRNISISILITAKIIYYFVQFFQNARKVGHVALQEMDHS
jgi:hypothetical protein